MTSIDFTKTSTYADLLRYWASEDYTIEAKDEGGSWESIDHRPRPSRRRRRPRLLHVLRLHHRRRSLP